MGNYTFGGRQQRTQSSRNICGCRSSYYDGQDTYMENDYTEYKNAQVSQNSENSPTLNTYYDYDRGEYYKAEKYQPNRNSCDFSDIDKNKLIPGLIIILGTIGCVIWMVYMMLEALFAASPAGPAESGGIWLFVIMIGVVGLPFLLCGGGKGFDDSWHTF